ncbi:DUF11 domain-containing protein [Myroides odoratus]|uniref:DUF11 domain-containing protein n=1 Tax=Myroides odoratus TaxID=256 RepID=UPI0039AF7F2F
MKEKITISLWMRLLILVVLIAPWAQGYGQTKVAANTQTNGKNSAVSVLGILGAYTPTTNTNLADILNPTLAVDGSATTAATMKSTSALLATGESWLQMQFPSPALPNTTTFVKIGKPVARGLSVDLLGLVGGLLGLLSENIIIVEAYNGNTKLDNVTSTIVEDATGAIFVKATPNQAYTSIRLKLRSQSNLLGLSLGAGLDMDVYEAFYYTGDTSCGRPLATGVESAGLNVNLLGGLFTTIGTNQYGKSIDTDVNTYSVLKAGNLLNVNVGSHISQVFQFPNKSKVDATFTIKLGPETGLLDVNLISGIEIRAYDGNNEVYVRALRGGLLNGVDILGLLQGNTPPTLTFAPGRSFDKVEVRLNTAVNIGLASGGLRIYDVQRYDGVTCINPNITIPTATATPFETASCTTSLVDFQNVDFATNVLDNNNETYATLYAKAGTLLAGEYASGMLQMAYPNTVPAYTTSYIRIDMEAEIINKLVGGTLGGLVGGLTGILLGDHYFEVDAYNGSSVVSHATSQNGFSSTTTTGGKTTLVQDKIGRFYIAVTPNQPYTSIKITNKVGGIPNGAIRTLKVYNMCREIGTDACFAPQFTSYDQTGLTVSIGDLSSAGVKNPYYAISDSSSDYAEISNGLVSVAGTVNQTIYFNQPSQVGDQVKVRLQLNTPSLLSLDLLGRYKVITYLGNEQKQTFTLQQGLVNNLNLLNLFRSGGIQTLTFPTTQIFDRVDIQVQSLVSVSAAPSIRLYDVKRVNTACLQPTVVSPFIAPVCATQLVDAKNANDIDNLFDDNFDSYATLQSGAGILLGLGNKYEGFVELGYTNPVPAHTTSYVRIDFEGSALKQLIGGSLGNIVTGLLDGLLLGNHSFVVTVKDANGNPILEESSQAVASSLRNGKIRVVVDKLGRTYLAITPTQAYKTVRITDKTDSAIGLLAQPNTMNVYGMCYETGSDSCVAPFSTSFEYEGINLSVNLLGGAGVTYPERAIDDNSTHGSQMSLGTISVAGGVKQWINFNSLSQANDVTNIRMKVGTGGISLSLLENLEIAAYRGDVLVDRLNWNNGLLEGTDILGLLNSTAVVDIPFKPNGQYDRIAIGIKNVVSVGVFPPIEIYKVERLCQPQQLVSWKSYKVDGDATIDSVSGGEVVEYTIHVKNTGTTTVSQFTVTDKWPVGTAFRSSVAGRLSDDGEEVIFDFTGAMLPNSERQFVFSVDVNETLVGISEIKNIAFTKEAGNVISYPSYPPVDNTNPTQPDLTKNPGTIIAVTFDTALPKAVITSNQAPDLCENTTFTLDSNIAVANADTYQWYINGEAIDQATFGSGNTNVNYGKEKTLISDFPGSYTVNYTKGSEVAEMSNAFVVTQKESPVITFSGSQQISTRVGQIITLPTATSSMSGTIEWYDHEGNLFNDLTSSFAAPGIYTFTVVAISNEGCESFENIIITVYDDSLCPPTVERVYARHSSSWGAVITGGVTNQENAIDGNPQTYSTLTTGLGLLGIGTVWQNINFDHIVPAGTPVSVKLGKQYSLLVLAGGISVQGLDANGNTIGTLKSVQGGLLDLLAADNVVEFTFVPSDKSGPKDFKGIRISQGSLVGLAQIAKVFSVHYTKNVTQFSTDYCQPVADGVHPSVLDVLHGVQDLGLGVASATASVTNAWNAVDNDPTTYATIARGVAVLNAASLTVIFKQQAMPGDKVHIVTEIPGNPLLSLELIKGYTIQRYLGEHKVGPELDGTNGAQLLSLKLLGLGYSNKYKIIVSDVDQPFDRVKISYGSVVGVLGDLTKIYEVSVVPKIDVGVDIETEVLEVCKGGTFTINPGDGCSIYEVFTAEMGGLPLTETSANKYNLPTNLPEFQDELPNGAGLGPKYSVIYVQTYRNGCLVGKRLPIRLHMNTCVVKSNLNVTQKIK